MMNSNDPAITREKAGVWTAFLVVMAYVTIGFLQMLIPVFTGQPVQVPSDWNAAMLGLAGGALGYLIGKQTTSPQTATLSVPVGDTVSTTTTVDTK